MVDFTSAAHQFAKALTEGDFYRALGVPEEARRLEIDVAAARMSDRAPELAGLVTAVANVLTNRHRKATYKILCELRDRVCQTMADRYGGEFHEAIPEYRAAVWGQCCELLRFGLDQSDIVVGPRGAASLAKRGRERVIGSVLISRLVVLKCTERELYEGVATREVWYTECPVCHGRRKVACRRKRPGKLQFVGDGLVKVLDFGFKRFDYDYHVPACPGCRAKGVDPSVIDCTYTFRFASQSPTGTIVRGEGEYRDKACYAVVDGAPKTSCSPKLLEAFYIAQQGGRDVTLDEVEDSWEPASPQVYAGEGDRRASADTAKGGTGSLSWVGIALLFIVIRAGCEATSRWSRQHENRMSPNSAPWNSPAWQSPIIEPSHILENSMPDWNRTLRDTPAPSEQSISQDLSAPPDEDDSQLNYP